MPLTNGVFGWRSAVPGTGRRLSRHLPVVIGLVVAGVLSVSMAGFERYSVVRVDETIDARWRGDYDLLVRGDGQRHALEDTLGLVEPNFLAFAGEGGLSIDDVASIAAIEDVEVAAPVATVGVVTSALPRPLVWVDDLRLPERPTEYRIRWVADVDDGAVARVLAEGETHAVLRQPDMEAGQLPVNVRGGHEASWTDQGVTFAIGSLPEVPHLLVAVDPEAEAALLGELAPQALGRLSSVDVRQRTVSTFDLDRLSGEFVAERSRLRAQRGALERAERSDGPVVPVIVAERLPAHTSLTIDVEQGAERTEVPTEITWMPQTVSWSSVGSERVDLTERVRPFTTPEVTAVWPGSAAPEGSEVLTGPPADLRLQLAGRPGYVLSGPPDRDAPTFSVSPGASVTTTGAVATDADEAPLAHERAYRPLFDVETGGPRRPILAPIGRFDPSQLEFDDGNSHAPLGIYGSIAARRVDSTGTLLQPTLNPRGLLTPAPVAMTDLVAASELRGEHPVDAVRVRVGGIETYDADAVAKVEQVASRIRSLGFEVDVVAGASLQPVEIDAAGYLPDGGGVVVEQPWTTLGAATRVEQELGATGRVLRMLGLAAALVLVPILQATALQVRGGERMRLHQLGWSRRQVSRWFLREALLAGVVVMAVAAIAVATGWARWDGAWPTLPIAAAFPLTAWVWLWLTSPASGSTSRRRQTSRGPLRQPKVGRVMWRELAAAPLRPVLRALAIALAATAIGATAIVLGSLAGRAGPSELARASLQASAPAYLAMLAAIVIGAATVIVVLAALDRSARLGQRRLLITIGFEPARLNRHARHRELVLGLSAAAAALWLVGRLAAAAQIAATTSTIVVTVATALVASMASSFVGRTT